MKAHHVLMVKRDKDGTPVEGNEVPNNEWAQARKAGWEFGTPDECKAWDAQKVEQAIAANAPPKEETEAPATPEKKKTSQTKKT